jgi:two-component system cell cycle sensor histidine kinase/response regulator CckA
MMSLFRYAGDYRERRAKMIKAADRTCRYKVLIVDDDIHVRNIVKEMLSLMEHSCKLAANGAEALIRTGEEDFDAVITDVQMPHMDGITLARELHKRKPSLPVMVMTGFADMGNYHDHVLNSRGVVLAKPFTAEEFFSSFNAMMLRKASASEASSMHL